MKKKLFFIYSLFLLKLGFEVDIDEEMSKKNKILGLFW